MNKHMITEIKVRKSLNFEEMDDQDIVNIKQKLNILAYSN